MNTFPNFMNFLMDDSINTELIGGARVVFVPFCSVSFSIYSKYCFGYTFDSVVFFLYRYI